jgi:23S rRNA pseudouridine1911/1915/1917 synthase
VKTKILFEDDFVIVADKPPGLLTIATARERERTAYAELRNHVKQQHPSGRIFVVHRLDREASGLLVFARTPESKDYLQNQFRDHSAKRRYIAVVEGQVHPETFTIRSALAENAAYRVYSTRKAGAGKPAVTHVRVLKRGPRTSLIELQLETGRKHQIRVHLAERGHAIIGDVVYGSRSNPMRRLALHASQLQFRHPRTGKVMHFESPMPTIFATLK